MKRGVASGVRFLPVGLDVRERLCLVVGGGSVATRKVESLAAAGARVKVVAPSITTDLAAKVDAGTASWIEGRFEDCHLEGAFLVVAATDDTELNARIVGLATHSGALVCDASAAERSQVIFGALLHSGGTTVAVFTDGRNPARARLTRDRIADLLGARPE